MLLSSEPRSSPSLSLRGERRGGFVFLHDLLMKLKTALVTGALAINSFYWQRGGDSLIQSKERSIHNIIKRNRCRSRARMNALKWGGSIFLQSLSQNLSRFLPFRFLLQSQSKWQVIWFLPLFLQQHIILEVNFHHRIHNVLCTVTGYSDSLLTHYAACVCPPCVNFPACLSSSLPVLTDCMHVIFFSLNVSRLRKLNWNNTP